MSDFYNHTSNNITNFDLLCDGLICQKCGKLFASKNTDKFVEYQSELKKQTELYKKLVKKEPVKIKTFEQVYGTIQLCNDCEYIYGEVTT